MNRRKENDSAVAVCRVVGPESLPDIDIQRRFHDLKEKEFEDTELLLSWSEYEVGSSIGWSDLLKEDRVVLLAEAGAGKTMEMVEQTNRLVGEGRSYRHWA